MYEFQFIRYIPQVVSRCYTISYIMSRHVEFFYRHRLPENIIAVTMFISTYL